MPHPDAPEPADAARDRLRAEATELDTKGPDLDATPAFLRDRTAAGRAVVPRSVVVPRTVAAALDPGSLPMPGVALRRLLLIAGTILLAWLAISFGRQVADASAASARAIELRSANAALADEVAALERELQVIQEQRYITLAARAFRLGSQTEIPFALQANAPAVDADAAGSAAHRLGAESATRSPAERWLDVLFGPGG